MAAPNSLAALQAAYDLASRTFDALLAADARAPEVEAARRRLFETRTALEQAS